MRGFKVVAVIVTAVIISCSAGHIANAEDIQYRMNISIVVDGTDMGYIAAFDDNYENNLYISLKGLASALRETGKAFNAVVDKKSIEITTGTGFDAEVFPWSDDELSAGSSASAKKHSLSVDGTARKYPSFIFSSGGEYDAYFMPVCLSMILDVDIDVTDSAVVVNTLEPYSVTPQELEASGYLQDTGALFAGDATTGTCFYE